MKKNPKQCEKGSKAMYGMVAKVPDENLTEEFVVYYMDQVYRYRWKIDDYSVNFYTIFFFYHNQNQID